MTSTPEPRILSGPEAIAAGVRELVAGGLVAFPTETVYGLGADAFDAEAVERIFVFKGRPPGNPLIVHVSGVEMARRVVTDWSADAETLAKAFWPGPLTLVLPGSPDLPGAVTAGGRTVGVRCPDHPVALALIEASGLALVGPSANPSGRVSPTTADHVAAGFPASDLLVIDGGACRAGIESTVLDLTADPPRVLRAGVIGAEAIATALERAVSGAAHEHSGDRQNPVASPGLLGPHYQPRTPVGLVTDAGQAASGTVLIAWSVDRHPAGGVCLAIPAEPGGYAAALYARLHDADRCGAARILIERPVRPNKSEFLGIFRAIEERLIRASGG
jgi:L-threonylcarbamoyladenylate synthase